MKFTFTFCLLLLLAAGTVNAQDYFDGKFKIKSFTHQGYRYNLYEFSRDGNVIKAKYFARNAYSQYLQWKAGKQILLVTAGAFSDTFDSSGIPVGLCVDNGLLVNRAMRYDWDAMVIVYNGDAQQGGIAIVDLSQKPVTVKNGDGSYVSYYIKNTPNDKLNFLNWGVSQGVTLFQSMLAYSSDKLINTNLLYDKLNYGIKRERRFLAICKKDNIVTHVIVDAPDQIEMNRSSLYAKSVLEYDGFTVLYIINLDTGNKNVFYQYNGNYLENMHPTKDLPTLIKPDPEPTLATATNLLIYYKD